MSASVAGSASQSPTCQQNSSPRTAMWSFGPVANGLILLSSGILQKGFRNASGIRRAVAINLHPSTTDSREPDMEHQSPLPLRIRALRGALAGFGEGRSLSLAHHHCVPAAPLAPLLRRGDICGGPGRPLRPSASSRTRPVVSATCWWMLPTPTAVRYVPRPLHRKSLPAPIGKRLERSRALGSVSSTYRAGTGRTTVRSMNASLCARV